MAYRTIGGVDYIKDNVSYLADLSDKNSYYNFYSFRMLIPILVLLVALIPGVMFAGLFYYGSTGKLETSGAKYKYGFLYSEYQSNAYLWEFVKIFIRIFIIMILQFYEDEIAIKGSLIFLLLVIYGILSKIYSPF